MQNIVLKIVFRLRRRNIDETKDISVTGWLESLPFGMYRKQNIAGGIMFSTHKLLHYTYNREKIEMIIVTGRLGF